MSVNYFVVYTPALSLSHQIIMDFPVSHVPVKCSGPEASCYSLHTCSSVHRQSCSVVIMMSGLRTIPDISLIPIIQQFYTCVICIIQKKISPAAPCIKCLISTLPTRWQCHALPRIDTYYTKPNLI